MTGDTHKSDRVIHSGHEAARSEAAQQVAARLHDDTHTTAPGRLVEIAGERVVQMTVKPQDTLRNLGRELYRHYGHREATEADLKAFELEAARRNKLETRAQRDNLQPGQELTLIVPGVKLPGAQPRTASREAQELMKGASSCTGEWSNMVAQWVTHNEVSKQKFVAFNPDDGGHGISVGLLQWNQKRGRLPELLQDWHHKDPAKFDRMFGSQASNLLKPEWVRGADFVGNPTLYRGMQQALADSEFQQVQLGLRNRHIVKSCEVAQSNGFKSLRGRAVVADLFNQIGESGTVQAMRKVSPGKPESARIEDLKKVTGGRVNGQDRVSSIEEKVKDIWHKLGSS